MIKRMFQWSKWCSAALVMLLLLVSLLVGLALFTNLGLNSLVSLAEKAMPQLSVGSAEGALLPKFTLREVRFRDDALHLETSLDELGLAIDMGCFWQGQLCVDDLRLHGLALNLPELAPAQGELVVRKTVPSAFFGTSLHAWLAQRGVQTLVVAGAVTSGCVRASVVDAMQFGFRPLVLSDCVGDRAIAPHDANLFDMEQKYATVMTRDEALAALAKL